MNNYYIHPTSILSNDSKIGDSAKIWQFCHIFGKSIIGNNSTLGQNVMVGPNVSIGSNCKIQNNVSLYNGIKIENNVFLKSILIRRSYGGMKGDMQMLNYFIGLLHTLIRFLPLGIYFFTYFSSAIYKDIRSALLLIGLILNDLIGYLYKQWGEVIPKYNCGVFEKSDKFSNKASIFPSLEFIIDENSSF